MLRNIPTVCLIGMMMLLLAVRGKWHSPDIWAPGGHFPERGTIVGINRAWIGCSSREALRRLNELVQTDRDEAAHYAAHHDCIPLQLGFDGTVEDVSLYPDAMCIRGEGDSNCYWFPTVFLDRDEKLDEQGPLFAERSTLAGPRQANWADDRAGFIQHGRESSDQYRSPCPSPLQSTADT